jgi:hypothetical protein
MKRVDGTVHLDARDYMRIYAGMDEDEANKIDRLAEQIISSIKERNKNKELHKPMFGKMQAIELLACLGMWMVNRTPSERPYKTEEF